MDFPWLRVILIAVCTFSLVVDHSFARGSGSDVAISIKELEPPAFCVLFLGPPRVCYDSALGAKRKLHFWTKVVSRDDIQAWHFTSDGKDSKNVSNKTYDIKDGSIKVTITRLSQDEKVANSPETITSDSSLMSGNITVAEPAPQQSLNEHYIIEVTVSNSTSNVSASIKIKFAIHQTSWPDLLIWVMIVIFIVLLLVSPIYYRYYRLRRASMKGPMFFVKYRNSSSHRLMSESDDSPYKFSAYLQNIKEFESHVYHDAENGILEYQFRSLFNELRRPCEYGRLPVNKPKNRYRNVIPYDETRVILDKGKSKRYSDYINANYIQGYLKEKAYIATQGPLPGTIVDFWRMIWQEKSRIICMLVDLFEGGEKMCDQYWPEVGGKMKYGSVIVSNVEQRVFADYTYRIFWVTTRSMEEMRKTGWPNEGVPMYSHSVAEYLTKLLSIHVGQGPIVVHCNAGIGRTGAIILCDITLGNFAAEGSVNVFAKAKQMYKARANMLCNFPEYVLAHLMPCHCLLFLPTKVPCREISPVKIAEMKVDLRVHMNGLDECAWMDKALCPLGPLKPSRPENLPKNRFPKQIGDKLVTLTRYPSYDENSDYISAVSVDGVRSKNQYLASQLPMPSTLIDFWRLILEKNVELVVILQRPDPKDVTCCVTVPHCRTIIPVPNIKAETKVRSNKSSKHFTTDILLLTDNSVTPARSRSITTLTCNNWSYGEDAKPPAPEALVALWKASENIRRVEGPTLVLCHNGVTGCGLYLALSFMLERMALEQECDVILAVRAVRRSRQDKSSFTQSPNSSSCTTQQKNIRRAFGPTTISDDLSHQVPASSPCARRVLRCASSTITSSHYSVSHHIIKTQMLVQYPDFNFITK